MHERSLSRTFWNAKEMQEKSLPGFQPENHYNEIHARNRQALWCSSRKISEYSFNIYILKCWNFIKILIRSFLAFYFSNWNWKKSCGHGLCIESQNGSQFCNCAPNSSHDEFGVCVKSKKPSKIFPGKNSPNEILKALFLDTRWYTANGFFLHSLNSNGYSLYSRYNIDHDWSYSRAISLMYFWLNFEAQSNPENHVTPTKFDMLWKACNKSHLTSSRG